MSKKHRLPSEFDRPRLKQAGYLWAIEFYRPQRKKRGSKEDNAEALFIKQLVKEVLNR